jgi:hypothetical protein
MLQVRVLLGAPGSKTTFEMAAAGGGGDLACAFGLIGHARRRGGLRFSLQGPLKQAGRKV